LPAFNFINRDAHTAEGAASATDSVCMYVCVRVLLGRIGGSCFASHLSFNVSRIIITTVNCDTLVPLYRRTTLFFFFLHSARVCACVCLCCFSCTPLKTNKPLLFSLFLFVCFLHSCRCSNTHTQARTFCFSPLTSVTNMKVLKVTVSEELRVLRYPRLKIKKNMGEVPPASTSQTKHRRKRKKKKTRLRRSAMSVMLTGVFSSFFFLTFAASYYHAASRHT
jgi:hypothetical protein